MTRLGGGVRVAGLVVLATLLLAGCGEAPATGSQAGPSASPTASPTPTPEPTSGSPTPDPAEPTGLDAGDDGTWRPWWDAADPPLEVSDTPARSFTSPDGVVSCRFGGTAEAATVRCDRSQGLGVDQPKPVDCTGGWGDAVRTSTGSGGELVCARRPLTGAGATRLAAGEAWRHGELTCTAAEDGVQCLGPGRRGFVISGRVIVVR